MIENYPYIRKVASKDVDQLEAKGKTYGSSWRNRGGVGAFMMLARKWDRIEQQTKAAGYDIFKAIDSDEVTHDGLLDDIGDLRRYLLLVEGHMAQLIGSTPARMREMGVHEEPDHVPDELCGPGPGYVNQD